MPRKSGRLSRVLTERSRYAGQPEDSQWIDYLDDTRGAVQLGTLTDKTRLSEGAPPRGSKWWVALEDSVNVPPPLTAEPEGAESDSPFSSGDEMSGKRPAQRREILRAAKRKRGTDEGFADVFDETEPAAKRKSSSVKRSSTESVYEANSPVVQPRRGEKKGALFRKRGRREDAENVNKAGNSRLERVFNDGDDEVSTLRRVQDRSVSDKSVSPDLGPARRPKTVLKTKKSRTRTAQSDLEVSFSEDEDDVPKVHSSASKRSPSPVSKPRGGGKKDLLKRKSRNTRSDLQVTFSDDSENDDIIPNSSKNQSQRSGSQRSASPASKPERTSKKELLTRKSRNTWPDLQVSFSEDEDGNSNLVEATKRSTAGDSPSPASKPRGGGKKDLLKRKSRNTRSDLQVTFSDDEDGNSNLVEATKRSTASKRSPSPVSKPSAGGKKDLIKRKSRNTRSDLQVSFSEDEDGNSNLVEATKRSTAADRSLSPVSKPRGGGKKDLLKRKPRNTRSDLQVSFSEDEDGNSNLVEATKRSTASKRSPSPVSKPSAGGKKDLIKRKSRNTRSDLQVSFSEDEDGNSNLVEATKLSTAGDSPSPASKPRGGGKKDLLKRKSRNTRSDLQVSFSEDEDGNSNLVEATKLSTASKRSPSPVSKPRGGGKKDLLKRKSRNARSDLQVTFSEDEDGNSNLVEATKRSTAADRSPSPASKPRGGGNKDLLKRKSRNTRSDLQVTFSEDEDGNSNLVEATKRSTAGDSPSPASKPRGGGKKDLLKRKSRNTRSDLQVTFSDDSEDDDIIPNSSKNQSQRSQRSASPAAKPARSSQKDLLPRKSRTTEGKSSDVASVSHSREESKRLSPGTRSPVVSRKRASSKALLQRKQPAAAGSAFDQVSFSDDDERADDPTQERSASHRSELTASGSRKLTKKDSTNMSDSTAFKEKSFDGDQASSGSNVRRVSKRLSSKSGKDLTKDSTSVRSPIVGRKAVRSVPSPDETTSQAVGRQSGKSGLSSSFIRSVMDKSQLSDANTSKRSKKYDSYKSPGRNPLNNSDLEDVDVNDFELAPAVSSVSRTAESSKRLSKVFRGNTAGLQDNNDEVNVISDTDKNSATSVAPSPIGSVSSASNPRDQAQKSLARISGGFDGSRAPAGSDEGGKVGSVGSERSINSWSTEKGPTSKSIRFASDPDAREELRSFRETGRQSGKSGPSTSFIRSVTDKSLLSDANTSKRSKKDDSYKRPGRKPQNNSDLEDVEGSVRSERSINSRSTEKGQTSRSLRFRSDPDAREELRERGGKSYGENDGKVSLDRSRGSAKDMAQKSSGAQKDPPITPLGKSATMPFAQDANFTNFNPQANSTKVLHMSKSMLTEPSPGPSSRNISTAGLRRHMDTSSHTPRSMQPSTAAKTPSVAPKVSANVLPGLEPSKDAGSDSDQSRIESWSGSAVNLTVSDTPPRSIREASPQEATGTRKSLPQPAAVQPPVQAPVAAATKEKYTPEEAAARRKEYFATILERAKKSYPQFAPGAPAPPVKQSTITDFYPKTAALPKPRKERKPVDPSLMVNGKPWRPPKLARPARWCTDRLYSFVQKRTEELYGELKKRRKSEEFVVALAFSVKKAIRCKKNSEPHVLRVVYLLHRLGLIETLMDFYIFVENYMPGEFSDAALPKRRALGKITGAKFLFDANVMEPIDFTKYPAFEK